MRVTRLLPAMVLLSLLPGQAHAQTPTLPDAPTLQTRTAPPEPRVAMVNGVPYIRPTSRQFFHDYLFDTYWYPGMIRSTIRALYAEGRGKPTAWDTDFTGFMQRLGSAEAITVINGNVRFGMEMLFHEDLRYLPCKGCSAMHKIENALLSEITARHDDTGRRFFTLTPTVADFSGPIIAHTIWYPGNSEGPLAGVISARTVFATRIGAHLFKEFALDRHHKKPEVDAAPKTPPPPAPAPPAAVVPEK